MSAYEAFNGKFNYDATPLAPPGCLVISLETTQTKEHLHHMALMHGT